MTKTDLYLIGGGLLLVVMGSVAGLNGCASVSGELPTVAQLAELRQIPSGADPESLRRGRALAVTECAGCHRFFWPHEYGADAWAHIIRRMGRRSPISADQMADLELYFRVATTAQSEYLRQVLPEPEKLLEGSPPPPGAGLEALARGRAIAVSQCARCHRPYLPHEYGAKAWTDIIRNMAKRSSLSDQQVKDLELYYEMAVKTPQKAVGTGSTPR